MAVLTVLASAPASAAGPLDLTAEERAWMAAHPDITVGVVSDNEPYSFYRNGQILGWSIDLLRRIEADTGLRMTLRMGSWSEVFSQFRAGRLTAIEAISQTEERRAHTLFTQPYHLRRTMLFHNGERPLPRDPSVADLHGKRLGVVRDIYYIPALRAAGLELVEYAGYRDLMAALAFGWVDAAVAPELTGNFFARANGFTALTVAGPLPVATVALEDFRIGVGVDAPLLRSILDKAISAIPEAELTEMTERWRHYRGGVPLAGAPFRLLPEEQAFVAAAPVLKVGFMPDYEPFSYLADGRGQGFAVELAQDLADRVGLSIEPVFDTWPRLLERFRAGELDMLADMSFTEARAAHTLFTRDYYRIPNAVFVRDGFGAYTGVEALRGKRVGLTRDVFYQDRLLAAIGGGRGGTVVPFTGMADMMRALAAGEVDAVVASLPSASLQVHRLGLYAIKIAGEFRLDGVEREDLRFGIAPRLPYLHSLFDRLLATLPAGRWAELENRWLGPRLMPPPTATGPVAVPLTPQERGYLDSRGVVRVCADPDYPPFGEVTGEGTYRGVGADILHRLAERGGFPWQVVPAHDRRDMLAIAAAGGCDLMPLATEPPSAGWLMVNPYLRLPSVLATRLDEPFPDGLSALNGRLVGVVGGPATLARLKERHPGITFAAVDSESEGLALVRSGTHYGLLGTLPSLSQQILGGRLNDVKIATRLPGDWQAGVAVNAQAPELAAIIGKLAASLSDDEVQGILSRWMAARVEEKTDMGLILRLGAGATALLVLFALWNRKLRRLNQALNAANGRLQELSVTDGLTGLANRAFFDAHASESFGLCQRNGLRFTVAMIDIDHFKQVNDQLGHPFGDTCLKAVAVLLQAHFQREGDTVARYGGEEFVACTVGGLPREVASHLEAVRAAVAAQSIRDGALERRVTLSIGWHSAVPQRGETLAGFLERADAALYVAKHGGRNRVQEST